MAAQPKRVIIGLGTGRCGTHTLTGLLDQQPGTVALHQPKPCLPWHPDYGWYRGVVELIESIEAPVVALVSWFYLNYVPVLARDFDATFICMQRDRDLTVDSILRLTPQFDNWSNQPVTASVSPEYRDLFPKYDVSDKREALERYWAEYYEIAREFEAERPDRVRTFPTEQFNSEAGVAELLAFAGYGEEAIPTANLRLGVFDEYRWTGRRRHDDSLFTWPDA